MRKYNYKTEILIKNLFGGTIRWVLVYIYCITLKKTKPSREEFVFGPKKEDDYFGYTNTQHKNTISAIISSFILFLFVLAIFKILF